MRKSLTSASVWYYLYHVVNNKPQRREKRIKKCVKEGIERGRDDVW
jgi:hypothetical protein